MHPNPFGLAQSLSPVDIPEPLVSPHSLRWTTTVIAVASLTLALLNAHAVRGWAWELPPGPWSERAATAAEGWYGLVGRIGLNQPVETMHGGWQHLREARFGPDCPADVPDAPCRSRGSGRSRDSADQPANIAAAVSSMVPATRR
jgi:hypothetical protein